VPFKDLEAATRSRLNYRALTDALNALVNDGAVRRVPELGDAARCVIEFVAQ